MPGRNIKNDQTVGIILYQMGGRKLPRKFPVNCFAIGDIGFAKEHLFADCDDVIQLDNSILWEHVAVQAELFDSVNNARKNNFKGTITEGWHEVCSGKGNETKFIFLWKETK
jgi:hypothetical protein